MYVVRNVSDSKIWKGEGSGGIVEGGSGHSGKKLGFESKSNRVLTDLVGPFNYTVVFETKHV
jgi:hypothetical protein